MNRKIIAILLAVIIIAAAIAGVAGYYIGTQSKSNSPTPTPTPAPSATPTPTIVPTPSPSPTATIKPTSTPIVTASPSPTPIPTLPPTTLNVFVAASMYNVVLNMSADFQKQYNCKLVINQGSSSTLEQQIAAGAACDAFMSADQKWTSTLNSTGLVYNNYVNNSFTSNKLVVIIAQGNPKNITSLADLAFAGTGANKMHLVIAQTSVPVGSYTNTTLTKITNTWGNSSSPAYITNGSYVNYYTNFQNNVVNYLSTDEQVVGAVNLNVGVADAGIVYYSDEVYANLIGETVQFLSIPDSVNTIGVYGICIPSQVAQPTMAQNFYNYWLSSQGQSLLTEFGFGLT